MLSQNEPTAEALAQSQGVVSAEEPKQVVSKTARRFSSVRRDIQRYVQMGENPNPPFLEKVRIFLDEPGLQAIILHRFGFWVDQTFRFPPIRKPLMFVYYIFQKLINICWGIYIDQRAEIGAGLYIGHFGGILIGPVRIGKNCNIAQNVCIGKRADGLPGTPVIGDRVWIGVGSVVFGGICIGDGVTIGPLTVVSRSLPPNLLVIGNPLRVLRQNYDNHREIYGPNVGQLNLGVEE